VISQVASQKNIQVKLILGTSAWSPDGAKYKQAEAALLKLSLDDLRAIQTVVRTLPNAKYRRQAPVDHSYKNPVSEVFLD
jgi:hypothetical protein